jgi:hypothetical protein
VNFRFHFSERSKPEIQEAYNWYEDQQVDLGEKFLLALDDAFARIASHPFAFSQKKELSGNVM